MYRKYDMKKLPRILTIWLPVVIVITGVCGLVYAAVQQSLRQSANDPQIQMAEDVAESLDHGATPESVLPHDPDAHVDFARSLAPFVVVFNDSGEVVATSGLLHGQPLRLPAGVLDNVRLHGESRLTLQPEPSVRIAGVIVRSSGATPGFVLAGRSLREIEKREAQTRNFATMAWFLAVGALLFGYLVGSNDTVCGP